MFDRDLDTAEAWVADWSASMSERAERARRLAERIAGLAGTATDDQRLVEVTVDSSGLVTGLRLDDRIRSWPVARIEREILTTMRRAQATLTRQVESAVAGIVGADTETGRAVLSGYQQRFPAVPDSSGVDGDRRDR